jgi:hypothetical protein
MADKQPTITIVPAHPGFYVLDFLPPGNGREAAWLTTPVVAWAITSEPSLSNPGGWWHGSLPITSPEERDTTPRTILLPSGEVLVLWGDPARYASLREWFAAKVREAMKEEMAERG